MQPVQSAVSGYSYQGFVGPQAGDKLAPPKTPAIAPSRPATGDEPGRLARPTLNAAVTRVMSADPKARIQLDRTSGSATFLTGSFSVKLKPGVGPSPAAVSGAFLNEHGSLFGVADMKQLKLAGVTKDQSGTEHARYNQIYNELPVFGQQIIVHSKGSTVTSVGGRLTPNIKIDTVEPRMDAKQALAAIQAAEGEGAPGNMTVNQLGIYTTTEGVPRLAWEMDLQSTHADGRWRYYVDAETGKVLDKWSTVHSFDHHEAPSGPVQARSGAAATADRPSFDSDGKRQTYDAQGKQSRPGKLARTNNEAPVADDHVNLAHDNAGAVYDYFKVNFNRDSLDNRGMVLKSTVHYGNKYNNAFWDGSQMTYGDGDGVRFVHFGDALDVVAHEMTHGVTEKTAGLRYMNQSGALNESWSDVLGNVVEKWDERRRGQAERDPKWLIGELIFTPKTDGDALRSMSEPGKGYAGDPQPGHMKDYKNTSSDNGGVHINSGIPNKAAYEVGIKLGVDKLGAIWYNTLTNYLTPSSQFVDAANFTVQSAADLYGATSNEVQIVRDAWTSVGITPSRKPGLN